MTPPICIVDCMVGWVRIVSGFPSGSINGCLKGCRSAMPSPGGKGDREAVDEERRHLTICNAVNLNGTDFSNVPFHELQTNSEHIAVPHPPQCAHWGTFPPGEGMVQRISANSNSSGSWGKTVCITCYWEFFKRSAWSAVARALMISSRSPSMTASMRYNVRFTRWSVTRPWGKL